MSRASIWAGKCWRSRSAPCRRLADPLYAETSSGPSMSQHMGFYLRRGYAVAAQMSEFYGPGDARLCSQVACV